MFAAVKSSHESELFKLALELIASSEQLPDAIVDRVDLILCQAKTIASTPSTISSDSLPEAIDLAIGLARKPVLSHDINSVDSVKSISPVLAATLLKEMESCSVY